VFQLVGLGRGVTVASSTSEAIERSSSTVVARNSVHGGGTGASPVGTEPSSAALTGTHIWPSPVQERPPVHARSGGGRGDGPAAGAVTRPASRTSGRGRLGHIATDRKGVRPVALPFSGRGALKVSELADVRFPDHDAAHRLCEGNVEERLGGSGTC
jgi:hypothetical protein